MGIRKLATIQYGYSHVTHMSTHANVFPLPVTASTTTSEFFMNMGMAACCTKCWCTKSVYVSHAVRTSGFHLALSSRNP
jgi:hypothetical protein